MGPTCLFVLLMVLVPLLMFTSCVPGLLVSFWPFFGANPLRKRGKEGVGSLSKSRSVFGTFPMGVKYAALQTSSLAACQWGRLRCNLGPCRENPVAWVFAGRLRGFYEKHKNA